MIFRIILAAFLMAVSAIGHTQTKKTLIGFQDIPWGSTIQFVKSKFSNAQEVDLCKVMTKGLSDEEQKKFRQKLRDRDENCAYLLISNYTVANINLSLNFYFNNAGKLDTVQMDKYFLEKDSPEWNYRCSEAYLKIVQLLTINYGTPADVSNISEFKDFYNNIEGKIWLPLPTQISTKRKWGSKFAAEKPQNDLCFMSIDYTKRGESKL